METRKVTEGAWPARYELLDGLRGLAALTVVLNHLGVVADLVGHFAVMVFFVISGYCITAATEAGRRNGMAFGQFMTRRLRRIFPPYFLAVAFFVLTRAVKSAMTGDNYLQWPTIVWLQNLTLTQWVSELFHPVASPVQNPSLFVVAFWSLNYEEQFYLVMAVALVLVARWRTSLIVPVLALAAIGLAWNWMIPGNWVCGLFLEYWVHFALGACLFFALVKFPNQPYRPMFISLVVILGLASFGRILLHKGDPSESLRAMTELAFLSIATLILFYARPYSQRISQSIVWRPFAALGTISYSLYLIHQFNLTVVLGIAHRIAPLQSPGFVSVLIELALFIGIATPFWWLCERPFLTRRVAAGHPISVTGAQVRAT